MLRFQKDNGSAVVNNLAIVAGLRVTETTSALLSEIADNAEQQGFEKVTVESLLDIRVVVDGKGFRLKRKHAEKLQVAFQLLALTEPVETKIVESKEVRSSKTRRVSKDTDSEEISRISRLVAEWRIPDDGSRPMSWKNVRAELNLGNEEFHKSVRTRVEFKDAMLDRIRELRSRPEGWQHVGRLDRLTGLDTQGFEDKDIEVLI